MKMYHHGQLPHGTIHPPHNWQVTDLDEITPTARDLNKWALVGDAYYRLVSLDPLVWQPLARDRNVDGGVADTVYLPSQLVRGGSAYG